MNRNEYEVHFDAGIFEDLTITVWGSDDEALKSQAVELAEALMLSPKIKNVKVTGTQPVQIDIPAKPLTTSSPPC